MSTLSITLIVRNYLLGDVGSSCKLLHTRLPQLEAGEVLCQLCTARECPRLKPVETLHLTRAGEGPTNHEKHCLRATYNKRCAGPRWACCCCCCCWEPVARNNPGPACRGDTCRPWNSKRYVILKNILLVANVGLQCDIGYLNLVNTA